MFWTLPTAFLSGATAAAGIAIINSIGNLSGFFAPFAMGWVKDATGSFTRGLLLAACAAAPLIIASRSATTARWRGRRQRPRSSKFAHSADRAGPGDGRAALTAHGGSP